MRQYADFLTSGIPIAILVVLIGRTIFQNNSFEHSTQWIRIILLTQAAITLITFFYVIFLSKDENLPGRFNDKYSAFYFFLFLSNTLLPLLLLNERLGKNLWVLLIVGILMNFGRIFESIVVMVTSYHRDYEMSIPIQEIETMIKGLLLGVVMISFEFVMNKHELRFVYSHEGNRINYKPFLIIFIAGMMYSLGFWFTSIYGLDPPYAYFYSGLILERIAILLLGLLVLNYLLTVLKRKPKVSEV
jgi:hypothetical protein